MALPFGLTCTLCAWALIILIVKPDDVDVIPLVVYERGSVFGRRNLLVMTSSLAAVCLFATSSLTKGSFGDISIISLSFCAFMFGTGILTEVENICSVPIYRSSVNPILLSLPTAEC